MCTYAGSVAAASNAVDASWLDQAWAVTVVRAACLPPPHLCLPVNHDFRTRTWDLGKKPYGSDTMLK